LLVQDGRGTERLTVARRPAAIVTDLFALPARVKTDIEGTAGWAVCSGIPGSRLDAILSPGAAKISLSGSISTSISIAVTGGVTTGATAGPPFFGHVPDPRALPLVLIHLIRQLLNRPLAGLGARQPILLLLVIERRNFAVQAPAKDIRVSAALLRYLARDPQLFTCCSMNFSSIAWEKPSKFSPKSRQSPIPNLSSYAWP